MQPQMKGALIRMAPAKAVELELSQEEIEYLEEPYIPHRLVGVMAQNTPTAKTEKKVWSTGNQKI